MGLSLGLGLKLGLNPVSGGGYQHVPVLAGLSIRPVTDTTGGSAQSGAVINFEAPPVKSPLDLAPTISSCMSIQCLAVDTFAWFKWTTNIRAGFKLSDVPIVGMWVYSEETQGGVFLNFSSDNHATKRWEFSWPFVGQVYPGWNLLTVRPDDLGLTSPNNGTWTVAGGMTIGETINSIGIGITSNGTLARKIWVEPIGPFSYSAPPRKGSVIFGIDGFGVTAAKDAITQYLANGIKPEYHGDGNLVTGEVGTFLDNVYAQGGSIVDQGGYTLGGHTNYTSLPANLQPDLIIHNIVWDRFPRNKAFWSWAFSAHNPTNDAVMKTNGFKMVRGGDNWVVHPNESLTHAAGPKLIGHGSWNIGNNGSPVATQLVLNRIDMAINSGLMVYIMYHGDFSSTERQTVIDYAKSKQSLGLLDIDTSPSYYGKSALGPTLA